MTLLLIIVAIKDVTLNDKFPSVKASIMSNCIKSITNENNTFRDIAGIHPHVIDEINKYLDPHVIDEINKHQGGRKSKKVIKRKRKKSLKKNKKKTKKRIKKKAGCQRCRRC